MLTLQTFEDEAEAIDKANATDYGLAATIYTGSEERSDRVSAAVVAGTVWVNCFYVRDLETPFGGARDSGIGREGGHHSFDFYSDVKTVVERTALFSEPNDPTSWRHSRPTSDGASVYCDGLKQIVV